LKTLWKSIVETAAADEQKLALLYYLVRDCGSGGSLAKTFLSKTYLPEKYQRLVSGLWEMDRCHFDKALDYLTDPSLLPPTFADDILLVLLTHPKSDHARAMAYYLTVHPPLVDQRALEAYFTLLVSTSIHEAYDFARQNSQHQKLFEMLVIQVHKAVPSDSRAQHALQLLGLPLSDEEEQWFEQCLTEGAAAQLPGAKDSLLMRRLARGHLHDATGSLARYKGTKVDGMNWEDIRSIATK
jgi:hypothetical protein